MAHDEHDSHSHSHIHSHSHAHPHEAGHSHGRHHEHGPVDEHREAAPVSVATYVVTCSDTRSKDTDEGGPVVRGLLDGAGHPVVGSALVKDDGAEIRKALGAAKEAGARVVIFTGGTGLSKRDVTIETLTPLFDKTITGFGELFRMVSFEEIGSAAMLSRAAAGVIGDMVVFALPGSPRAVCTAMERLVLPELGHVVREALR